MTTAINCPLCDTQLIFQRYIQDEYYPNKVLSFYIGIDNKHELTTDGENPLYGKCHMSLARGPDFVDMKFL